jgi:hypothetical protein
MRLTQATLPVVEHGRTEIHLLHWKGVEQINPDAFDGPA